MPASAIMSLFRKGQLHSGKGGPVVTDKKQATAILLSTLRKEGRKLSVLLVVSLLSAGPALAQQATRLHGANSECSVQTASSAPAGTECGLITRSVGTPPLAADAATQTTLAAVLTELQAKADLAETQPVSLATMPSTPVTGTFWQATQPVSLATAPSTPVTGTFWQATQPVSGTVTVTDGAGALNTIIDSGTVTTVSTVTSLTQMNGAAISMNTGVRDAGTQRVTIATNDSVPVTGTFWQATQPVSGTFWQATQPISGTVTANAGTGTFVVGDGAGALNVICDSGCAGGTQYDQGTASTATDTLSMAGAIRRDTAALDAGVVDGDRAALSTDSVGRLRVTAADTTQPVSGTFWQATQPVSGTVTANQGTANATPWNSNTSQIAGTAIVTGGLAGSQSIGGTAANNAAINQNPVLIAGEALSTQPAAATTGNQRRLVVSLDGVQYVRPGGPVLFSCGLTGIGTTLTQCQAAPGAGLSLYITDVVALSTTTTAGRHTLRFGTGTNCGTGTGNLLFNSASALNTSPANTAVPMVMNLTTAIKLTANNAVCVLGVATNTTSIQINGFTAP